MVVILSLKKNITHIEVQIFVLVRINLKKSMDFFYCKLHVSTMFRFSDT